jgi:hypothetical protein
LTRRLGRHPGVEDARGEHGRWRVPRNSRSAFRRSSTRRGARRQPSWGLAAAAPGAASIAVAPLAAIRMAASNRQKCSRLSTSPAVPPLHSRPVQRETAWAASPGQPCRLHPLPRRRSWRPAPASPRRRCLRSRAAPDRRRVTRGPSAWPGGVTAGAGSGRRVGPPRHPQPRRCQAIPRFALGCHARDGRPHGVAPAEQTTGAPRDHRGPGRLLGGCHGRGIPGARATRYRGSVAGLPRTSRSRPPHGNGAVMVRRQRPEHRAGRGR